MGKSVHLVKEKQDRTCQQKTDSKYSLFLNKMFPKAQKASWIFSKHYLFEGCMVLIASATVLDVAHLQPRQEFIRDEDEDFYSWWESIYHPRRCHICLRWTLTAHMWMSNILGSDFGARLISTTLPSLPFARLS